MGNQLDQAAACLWLFRRNNPGLEPKQEIEALGWARATYYRRAAALADPTPRLAAWLAALDAGEVQVGQDHDKIQWYGWVHDLLMIGQPPWGPDDFVNVDENLTLTVPKHRTVNVHETRVYREPVWSKSSGGRTASSRGVTRLTV
jgi:hypothetical protein